MSPWLPGGDRLWGWLWLGSPATVMLKQCKPFLVPCLVLLSFTLGLVSSRLVLSGPCTPRELQAVLSSSCCL